MTRRQIQLELSPTLLRAIERQQARRRWARIGHAAVWVAVLATGIAMMIWAVHP